MPEDLQKIQMKVHEHDIRLTATDKMVAESITEQRQIIRELHSLTNEFKVYIERNDQIGKASERLWSVVDQHNKDIALLKETSAANQPVIDAIRTLNNKLIWMVVAALLTPITMGAAIIFKVVS